MRSSVQHVAPSIQSSELSGRKGVKVSGALPALNQLFFVGNGYSIGGRSQRGQRGIGTLMLAVLEGGMRSYLNSAKWIRSEAERWMMSPRRSSPCAFAAACDLLGLDPHTVRAALGRLRSEQTTHKKTNR